VIVSPTRELAKQIFDVAAPYLVDVCVAPPMLLVGGSDPRGDVDALRQHGANLLVGTPGRLHDVMERTEGFLQFKSLELLILDEADRLLGMGFQKYVQRPLRVHTPRRLCSVGLKLVCLGGRMWPRVPAAHVRTLWVLGLRIDETQGSSADNARVRARRCVCTDVCRQLSSIMKRLPKQRRTGLFSATQTEAVEELARAGLRNAVRVAVKQGGGGGGAGVGGRRKGTKADVPAGESKTPSQLCLEYSMCEADVKIARFVRFLTTHANRKVRPRARLSIPFPSSPMCHRTRAIHPTRVACGCVLTCSQEFQEFPFCQWAGSWCGCLLGGYVYAGDCVLFDVRVRGLLRRRAAALAHSSARQAAAVRAARAHEAECARADAG
jgi:hypothetical protein